MIVENMLCNKIGPVQRARTSSLEEPGTTLSICQMVMARRSVLLHMVVLINDI